MSLLLGFVLLQSVPAGGTPPTHGRVPCGRDCTEVQVGRQPQPPGTGPRPLFTPGELVTAADYPAEAARQGLGGLTVARLTVSRKGTVSTCQITRSSGFEILDRAACALLTRRARFAPAKDGNGRAVPSFVSLPINWNLED